MDINKLNAVFPARSVQINGALCAYREAGQGPAIVLLHGIGSGAGSWGDAATRLTPRHRVIAWDAPGYGTSSALLCDSPAAHDYAERLHGLLTRIDASDVVLVGHSLGAIVAAAYSAGLNSVGVRQLILVSPALGYGDTTETQREQVRVRRLTAVNELGIDGMADGRAPAMLTAAATSEQLAWVRWNMTQASVQGYTQAVHLLCNENIERYALPDIPLNVLVGDSDTITPPAQSLALAERITASYSLISNAGHACHIEQGIQLADMIESLIHA
ncbi:MAG TPA: alpha/beta hydrolase [Eoetvoesiella sp.]